MISELILELKLKNMKIEQVTVCLSKLQSINFGIYHKNSMSCQNFFTIWTDRERIAKSSRSIRS
jgi:hypothetical protein